MACEFANPCSIVKAPLVSAGDIILRKLGKGEIKLWKVQTLGQNVNKQRTDKVNLTKCLPHPLCPSGRVSTWQTGAMSPFPTVSLLKVRDG